VLVLGLVFRFSIAPITVLQRVPNYTACWQRHIVCEQLAQSRYLAVERPGVELATSQVASQCPNHYRPTTRHGTGVATSKYWTHAEVNPPVYVQPPPFPTRASFCERSHYRQAFSHGEIISCRGSSNVRRTPARKLDIPRPSSWITWLLHPGSYIGSGIARLWGALVKQ